MVNLLSFVTGLGTVLHILSFSIVFQFSSSFLSALIYLLCLYNFCVFNVKWILNLLLILFNLQTKRKWNADRSGALPPLLSQTEKKLIEFIEFYESVENRPTIKLLNFERRCF